VKVLPVSLKGLLIFYSFKMANMGEVERLHTACRTGNTTDTEALLLRRPKLVNALDEDLGWSPLYRAIMCGQSETAQILLEYGANPNLRNRQGETPLHQAVCSSVTLTKLLLENDADPNVQQQDGDTPLHAAAFRGDAAITRLLLVHGAKTNTTNYLVSPKQFGKTALHYATEGGFVSVIQELLDAGASTGILDKVNANQKGLKPTDVAASQDLVRMLSSSPEIEVKQPNGTSRATEEIQVNKPKLASPDFEMSAAKARVSELDTTGRVNLSQWEDTDLRSQQDLRTDQHLYDFLERSRLEFLFDALRTNGFDDFALLLDTMRSEVPLTKEMILPFCDKVGHAARLLGLLELEAKGCRETYMPDTSLWCSGCPVVDTPSLEEWLLHLNIGSLLVNFEESGYDDLEHLRLLQKTKMRLTDDVLDKELGITMIGWRHRILMKLWQDTEAPVKVTTALLEVDRKGTSCRDCSLM
jgi:hypothetical protein